MKTTAARSEGGAIGAIPDSEAKASATTALTVSECAAVCPRSYPQKVAGSNKSNGFETRIVTTWS